MSIRVFIRKSIPLQELEQRAKLGQDLSMTYIRRFVENVPINWVGQEYTEVDVIGELGFFPHLYINVLTAEEMENIKEYYLEYMQEHGLTDFIGSRKVARMIASNAANEDFGETFEEVLAILREYYDYLEKNEPDKLIPSI